MSPSPDFTDTTLGDPVTSIEALDRTSGALGLTWKQVDGRLRVGPEAWVERLPPD